MPNLITSMTRFSTAMTVFGISQAGRMLTTVGSNQMSETVAEIAATLNSVSNVLIDHIDPSNQGRLNNLTAIAEKTANQTLRTFEGMFSQDILNGTTGVLESTRDATAKWVDNAAASLEGVTGSVQSNPNVVVFISRLLPPVAKGLSLCIPGRDSNTAWANASNNAEIMQLVAHCGSILPAAGTSVPLSELVDKAYAQGPFPALWIVEGLGHYYADLFYERGEVPSGVLTDPALDTLPDKTMTMLHAGIGLAFAKRNLEKITSRSTSADVRSAVENFITLCKNSSRPGYAGAAYESLGLVSRTFHGLPILRKVDEELAAVAPELVGYLWHGAGRGVYFSLPDFIPAMHTPWRAVDMCKLEPPHDVGRRNMTAGFAWALTLVNMRTPIVMETMLKYHGEEFAKDDAFSNGVMSAIVMRYDTAPDDPNLEPFCNYEPVGTEPRMKQLWEQLVAEPCRKAMHEYHPVLKKRRRLEEVFHYQDLGALVRVPANKKG
jgi:hypothetical protein